MLVRPGLRELLLQGGGPDDLDQSAAPNPDSEGSQYENRSQKKSTEGNKILSLGR